MTGGHAIDYVYAINQFKKHARAKAMAHAMPVQMAHRSRRLIIRTVSQIVNPAAQAARAASSLLMPGLYPAKGIEYNRRLLGHSNISTTHRYLHLDDRELAEAQGLVE